MKNTADRLIDATLSPPLSIAQPQVLDFIAWLSGIDEDRVTALHQLSAGDLAHAAGRIQNSTDAASLKDEWLTARHAQRNARTVQELEQEGAAWLF